MLVLILSDSARSYVSHTKTLNSPLFWRLARGRQPTFVPTRQPAVDICSGVGAVCRATSRKKPSSSDIRPRLLPSPPPPSPPPPPPPPPTQCRLRRRCRPVAVFKPTSRLPEMFSLATQPPTSQTPIGCRVLPGLCVGGGGIVEGGGVNKAGAVPAAAAAVRRLRRGRKGCLW